MAKQPDTPVQTFLRLVVMAGTLAVGCMAWRLYGPPAEDVAWLTNRAVELVDRALSDPTLQDGPAGQEISAPLEVTTEPAPMASATPWDGVAPETSQALEAVVDPAVTPATNLEPIEPLEVADDASATSPALLASLEGAPASRQLLEELRRLGADDLAVAPWGADGHWCRFKCSLPTPSGFRRLFDSIQPDPSDALAAVVRDVRMWRVASAEQTIR